MHVPIGAKGSGVLSSRVMIKAATRLPRCLELVFIMCLEGPNER